MGDSARTLSEDIYLLGDLLGLVDESSVFDDGRNDTLFGGGGSDWFIIGTKDKIKDKSKHDRVN